MLRRFAGLLVAIFTTCMLAFLVISVYINPAKDTLAFELAKVLLQVGFVFVIGAVISLMTFEYQRECEEIDKRKEWDRRKSKYWEELLKAILDQATESYNAVKKARRLLRAQAIIPETGSRQERVLETEYDRLMDSVNDAQLSFERLVGDVLTSKRAFEEPEKLEQKLRSIERYLEQLIDEYEHKRRMFSGEPPSKELASLPRLHDFLGPSRPSGFRTQVIEPYHMVQQLIRSDLLRSQMPAPLAAKDDKA